MSYEQATAIKQQPASVLDTTAAPAPFVQQGGEGRTDGQ